jgi:ribosome-associated protein
MALNTSASSTPAPLKIAKLIAKLASDKKAEDVVILDLKKLVNFCDYFVLCSGGSERQNRAIADHIEGELKDRGLIKRFKQDDRDLSWIVLDAGSVVTHIFLKQAREFYGLEYLWQEAKQVAWQGK